MTSELPWYAELREKWKPEHVRLLLVAESAPDDGGIEYRRWFFYSERLGADNLFRGVVNALYGTTKADLALTGKRPWLERLRSDGVFLIDLVPFPINKLGSPAKSAVQRENVPGCVERAKALRPDGIIVIKKDVFSLLDGPLRAASLPLLNYHGISFPLGNTRAEFVRDFRTAAEPLDLLQLPTGIPSE